MVTAVMIQADERDMIASLHSAAMGARHGKPREMSVSRYAPDAVFAEANRNIMHPTSAAVERIRQQMSYFNRITLAVRVALFQRRATKYTPAGASLPEAS